MRGSGRKTWWARVDNSRHDTRRTQGVGGRCGDRSRGARQRDRRGHRLDRELLHRCAGPHAEAHRGGGLEFGSEQRAAASARHRGARCERGRIARGLHRRRRRDRSPGLHDQGRRRGADAREDRRGDGAALRLHRRCVQAGRGAGQVPVADRSDPDGVGAHRAAACARSVASLSCAQA